MSPTPSPLPRIALAGATGNLGAPILTALLSHNYPVTILTRIGSTSTPPAPHPNLTIKSVDSTSTASLTPALQNIDVVISCFATSALDAQYPLIDAAVAAGVSRFIPADFGMDTQNIFARELPVGAVKAKTQDYLRKKAISNSGFSWTAIAVGWFLDWTIEQGILVDVKKHSAMLYNGGDVVFSATTLADIARAVVGVVENQKETRDRLVYVHSASVTQNQLIGYVKEKDGKEWTVVEKGTEEVREESLRLYEEGGGGLDVEDAVLGFCVVALFDGKYGGDFGGRVANDIVGIKEMDEGEVRKLVESFV